MQKVIVHTDGASRGNPGPASIAYTIDGVDGELITFGQTIGQTTNNQAEYRAMVACLEKLVELQLTGRQIEVISDSELMVKQINGLYRVKDLALKPIYGQVVILVSKLRAASNAITFTSVRRELNKVADSLANKALDEGK